MEILIIGMELNAEECRRKFGQNHEYLATASVHEAAGLFGRCQVVFDFVTSRQPSELVWYSNLILPPVFFETSMVSLSELMRNATPTFSSQVFGFCGLPTLLDRELLEVSLKSEADSPMLATVCRQLGTKYQVVSDRSGMVTPRVICMIINEAYFVLEEGTANRDDINVAMKLGTNYPWGPFEWCERIGIDNVYQVLTAMRKESNDERFRISSLLETRAM